MKTSSFAVLFALTVTVVASVAVSALPVTSPVTSPATSPVTSPVTLPVILPTNAVDVILVAPVTTPASITIVPSRTICSPASGLILRSVPESVEIVLPLILISSICAESKRPRVVIFVCAAVVSVPAFVYVNNLQHQLLLL